MSARQCSGKIGALVTHLWPWKVWGKSRDHGEQHCVHSRRLGAEMKEDGEVSRGVSGSKRQICIVELVAAM